MTQKTTTFEIGDVVELQSDPNRRLIVLDIATTAEDGAGPARGLTP